MIVFVFEIGFESQVDFDFVRLMNRVPSARSHKSRKKKISDLMIVSDL